MIWRFIVRTMGGFHEVWPVTVVIHDHGLTICWKRVVQFDWRVGSGGDNRT